jgi:uncharacterized protein YycO
MVQEYLARGGKRAMKKFSAFRVLILTFSTLLVTCGFLLFSTIPDAEAAATPARVQKIIAWAKQQLGVPYKFGGSCTPDKTGRAKGCDCSSLVQQAYHYGGKVSIPGFTGTQLKSGPHISSKNVKAGDLVFTGPDHVGMYIGGSKVIEAPHTGDHVKIVNFTSVWKWAIVRPTALTKALAKDKAKSVSATATARARPATSTTSNQGNNDTSTQILVPAALTPQSSGSVDTDFSDGTSTQVDNNTTIEGSLPTDFTSTTTNSLDNSYEDQSTDIYGDSATSLFYEEQ